MDLSSVHVGIHKHRRKKRVERNPVHACPVRRRSRDNQRNRNPPSHDPRFALHNGPPSLLSRLP